jgi:hypothetical protein
MRIMGSHTPHHGSFTGIGIAVPATMATGVVGADVNTHRAPASGPLAGIFFGLKAIPENSTELTRINAMGLFDAAFNG